MGYGEKESISKGKMIVLIMGLPGSGKTTLAEVLVPRLNAMHLNGDAVRKELNDWDFTETGRTRQADRMKSYALEHKKNNRNVVADFVCPTEQTRKDFGADYIVWMDTIKEGRFEDTNKMFEEPKNYDYKVTHKDAHMWAFMIMNDLRDKFGLGPHDGMKFNKEE
jgi:adenylylsulfate kinase